jgi:protein-L-isoaspartate(D-aspartate) O-methyltransferase
MNNFKKFQDKIVEAVKGHTKDYSISQPVIDAYYATPRHQFIKRYRISNTDQWIEITDQNLEENLAQLYDNNPIGIYGENDDFKNPEGKQIATVSQQSLVLLMIELLKLEKGHKVFELGAASGFNAALMGQMVGPTGKVVSVEIIKELIQNAQASVKQLGLNHVEIIEGDGGYGYEKEAPYDRAMFTAGANDLPGSFYKQIKKGGRLLFVLKNKGGAATLILFEKKADHFQSIYSLLCDFVPVTGQFHVQGLDYQLLDEILTRNKIKPKPVNHFPHWWGGANDLNFSYLTSGFHSFLSISEPKFEAIRLDKENTTFGLLDVKSKSLVVVKPNELISYGSTKAREYLLKALQRWMTEGMPGLANLNVKAYPIDRKIKAGKNEWLTKRKESQFLWSKPK